MIRRSMAILAWLVAGHAILAGLFWAFLQTPESNAFMLAVSGLLVTVMVLWASVVTGVGLMGWPHTGPMTGLLSRTVRRATWVVPALVVFAGLWWASGAMLAWHAAHSGKIDAWFIANAGWVGTAWLHHSVRWILYFVRFAIGVSLALAVFGAGLGAGWAGVASAVWLRRACSWRTLAIVGAALLAIWAGPWQLAYWRPASLPSTWVQPAFAVTKLVVLYIVINELWAVALWAIGRPAATVAPVVERVATEPDDSAAT